MKTAACLDVMPPFYKGLSQGEMGALVLVCMSLLSIPGIALALWFEMGIVLISALMLGIVGPFMLPKFLMRKLSRLKTHHCKHYAAKRIHHWRRRDCYITQTRRFATKRTMTEAL
ncbi:hypothetical protein [Vibrio sp. TBV020]|uniref:hypothetical protein n=1 Tax=Vibrio sp. TBV020 TaxID=3137398 RepID=UPI0038CDC72B